MKGNFQNKSHIILIIIGLLFLSNCNSVKYINITSVNNSKSGLKKGWWIDIYNNKKIKNICKYRDGKKNGICKDFHINGKVSRKAKYKKDKLNGIVRVYDNNGKLISKAKYKNGEAIKIKSFNNY